MEIYIDKHCWKYTPIQSPKGTLVVECLCSDEEYNDGPYYGEGITVEDALEDFKQTLKTSYGW